MWGWRCDERTMVVSQVWVGAEMLVQSGWSGVGWCDGVCAGRRVGARGSSSVLRRQRRRIGASLSQGAVDRQARSEKHREKKGNNNSNRNATRNVNCSETTAGNDFNGTRIISPENRRTRKTVGAVSPFHVFGDAPTRVLRESSRVIPCWLLHVDRIALLLLPLLMLLGALKTWHSPRRVHQLRPRHQRRILAHFANLWVFLLFGSEIVYE